MIIRYGEDMVYGDSPKWRDFTYFSDENKYRDWFDGYYNDVIKWISNKYILLNNDKKRVIITRGSTNKSNECNKVMNNVENIINQLYCKY